MTGELFSSRLRRTTFILMAFVIFVDLCASVYHLTTGGIHSGYTQLVLAFVLALSWYLVYKAAKYKPSSKKYMLYRWTGLSLIGISAFILLGLGIYHFGTPTGFRSGVTETSLALLLILLDTLLYISYKRPV